MGLLDALIFGVRTIFEGSTERPNRSRLSFGSGFTATDDPGNDWTRIEVVPTAARGDADGIFSLEAAVQEWAPPAPLAASHRSITAGSFTTTTSGTPSVDLFPHLGSSPLVVDDADFVAFASAVITARAGAADFASFRVSRVFSRTASGAVAAGAATADDGKDLQGTAATVPWGVPVLAWDTATKFPKITVDQAGELANVHWRATLTLVVHSG